MEALKKLGFTTTEIEIYKTLLNTGPVTILQLSQTIGKPRSTVHHSVENLKRKSLVVETSNNYKRRIAAEHPNKISMLIEVEQKKIIEKNKTLEESRVDLDKFILKLSKNNIGSKTEVRFIEGVEPIRMLYDEILQANEVKTYANITKIIEYFPENDVKFLSAMERGTIVWDMMTKDSFSLKKAKSIFMKSSNYKGKFFPDHFKLNPMDYLIWDANIAVINPGGIPTAVITKSADLADNARALYDLLWSFLPELE